MSRLSILSRSLDPRKRCASCKYRSERNSTNGPTMACQPNLSSIWIQSRSILGEKTRANMWGRLLKAPLPRWYFFRWINQNDYPVDVPVFGQGEVLTKGSSHIYPHLHHMGLFSLGTVKREASRKPATYPIHTDKSNPIESTRSKGKRSARGAGQPPV